MNELLLFLLLLLYLNLSCPAVSHICSLIFWPDTSTILVPNSTPMVWGQSAMTNEQCTVRVIVEVPLRNLHFFSVNWCSKQDLPTPISPAQRNDLTTPIYYLLSHPLILSLLLLLISLPYVYIHTHTHCFSFSHFSLLRLTNNDVLEYIRVIVRSRGHLKRVLSSWGPQCKELITAESFIWIQDTIRETEWGCECEGEGEGEEEEKNCKRLGSSLMRSRDVTSNITW